MIQSGNVRYNNAYAGAYALYFAKVAYATLWTQGFAYATQSYDTTLLKVYSGGSDDAQMLETWLWPAQLWLDG